MKKIFPLFLVLLLALWVGCGGDDDGGPGPTPEVTARVVVNTTAGAPSMSANDAAWDNVEGATVEVVKAGALPATAAPTVVSGTATMQAIAAGDDLFIRLQWDDTSFNVWRQHYHVDTVIAFADFDRKDVLEQAEDQLFVMFEDTMGGYWDTWNWRSLTTGAGGFAEGFNFVDSPLVTDAVGSKVVEIALENQSRSGDPTYVHEDTCEFNGFALYMSEKLRFDDSWFDTTNIIDTIIVDTFDTLIVDFDTFYDTVLTDTVYELNERTWPLTSGWTNGQRVPGWLIEDGAQLYTEDELGSRWDTRAVMDYDSTDGVYTVVLKRKMATGYDDDLDMSTLDSVMTRVVILNNGLNLFRADTWRGVSKDIWLVF
jgi:hypothetical protein